MNNHPTFRQSFVAEIIERIAPLIEAKVLIEPEYGFVGQITFKNGKKVLFRDRNFNINPQGSSEIARDKGYSDFFLKQFGYKTPESQTCFSDKLNERLDIKRTIDDGFNYAKKLGFPVILKPNNLSQGTLVVKVHNKREFYTVARKIFKRVSVMIVQRFYSGNDYRIVVLDNEIISAYQRIPLYIVGDGKFTIAELLKKKQEDFIKTDRDTVIEIDDFRIRGNLKRHHYKFESVLSKGEKLYLLDNANLSTGGDAIDVTDYIHPDFRELAINISRDMGLRMCGVDVISSDISLPLKEYVVIEINSAPGLDNYASMGEKQMRKVDELYLKVLKALEDS